MHPLAAEKTVGGFTRRMVTCVFLGRVSRPSHREKEDCCGVDWFPVSLQLSFRMVALWERLPGSTMRAMQEIKGNNPCFRFSDSLTRLSIHPASGVAKDGHLLIHLHHSLPCCVNLCHSNFSMWCPWKTVYVIPFNHRLILKHNLDLLQIFWAPFKNMKAFNMVFLFGVFFMGTFPCLASTSL